MPFNYQDIIDAYVGWIKDNSSLRLIEDGRFCEITTPFLDRHNDHLEIYGTKKDNAIFLTDDGNTLSDLEMSGVLLSSPKREKIFRTIVNGFGVRVGEKGELYVEGNVNGIGQKKHQLLQAILAVNDMFTLSQETVYSLFKEDVEMLFKSYGLVYSKDIKLIGKSGFDQNIDFLIPRSTNKPERLIRTINNPKKDNVMATIFAFNDIAAIREEVTSPYVIYNDTTDSLISQDSLEALSHYSIKTIPWSQREKCKEELALV